MPRVRDFAVLGSKALVTRNERARRAEGSREDDGRSVRKAKAGLRREVSSYDKSCPNISSFVTLCCTPKAKE